MASEKNGLLAVLLAVLLDTIDSRARILRQYLMSICDDDRLIFVFVFPLKFFKTETEYEKIMRNEYIRLEMKIEEPLNIWQAETLNVCCVFKKLNRMFSVPYNMPIRHTHIVPNGKHFFFLHFGSSNAFHSPSFSSSVSRD